MFPEKDGVDYSKLQMTSEGEYSITKRPDGKKILQKILSVVGSKNKHVTDLTGNVGGDTIMFALNFKTVDSIEYNNDNFQALKNNVEVFDLHNVKLHFGDSTEIYNWYTDILYIDPPWGGPDYKEKENLDLYLGSVRVDLFISSVLEKTWKPQYIFLKLPSNYNFSRFSLFNNVHKFAIRNFILFGITVKN
jgi:predicted RNA methylase